MWTVGLSGLTYNTKRNIASLPVNARFKKTYDALTVFRQLAYRLADNVENFAYYFHWDAGLNRLFNAVDLFHFFNTVSFGKTPWVTTFETIAPRMANYRMLGPTSRIGMRLIAGKHCKQLIGISDNAKQIQLRVTGEIHGDLYDEIEPKVTVVHPSQPLLVQAFEEKPILDRLTFTMVGNEFFRKGGKEVLLVFDRVLQKGHDIVLNIVSTLSYGDYASKTTEEDRNEALRLIERHPKNIRHFRSLKNEDVLRLLVNTHVGLLPTHADGYGYSIVEAQAAGCPVITTNLRASDEINSDKCGWMLRVPRTDMKFGVIFTPSDRRAFSNSIQEQLEAHVLEIVQNPAIVTVKGRLALERVKNGNDPAAAAARMNAIYEQALST